MVAPLDTSMAKASIGFIEGFMQDLQPFRDMLEALGYIDDKMNITEKGTQLLHEFWAKKGVIKKVVDK